MKKKFTNKILLAFTCCFCVLFSKSQTTVSYTGSYFSSIAVGDYVSVAGTSGSPAVWATFATTWGRVTAVIPGTPNQITYVAASSVPANTLSVFVWNNNTVQINASAVCRNLYIESGSTVNSSAASTGTIFTLTVGPSTYTGSGTTTITNDGNLGTNGTFALPGFGASDNGGISLNLGNNCFNTVLTGAGYCNIARIIENFGTHTAGSSKTFTIDQNVNLNATGSTIFTSIAGNSGDDHNINSTITINANKSVVFTNTDGRFNFGSSTSPTQRCGIHIYNINGTLDMSACNVSTSHFYPLSSGAATNFNTLNSNSILMLNVGANGTIRLPRNFNCYNSVTPALTGRAAINVYGTLVPLAITSANISSGGNISFKSDATSTGSIGSIGAIAATSYFPSTNNNNLYTVERYIPSLNGSNTRRAYTLVNSPVAATNVNTAWQEGSTSIAASSTTAIGSTATGSNYNLYSVVLTAVNPNIRKGMTVTGTNIQANTQVLDTASLAAYGATSTSNSVVLGYYAQTDNPYLTAGMSVTGSGIPANTTITNVGAFSTTTGVTGTAAITSNSVTVSNASSLQVGMIVSGTGIPVNTTITAISANTLTISNNTTAALSATALTFTYRILTLSNATTSTLANTLLNIGAGQILLLTRPVTAGLTSGTLTFTNNYGTQITGGVAAGTNGFDGPSTSGNSIFTYDDTKAATTKWTALASTTASSPANGYLLFARGDRSVDRTTTPGSITASATTLRATGVIAGGNITPTLTTTTANLFNLVANPYPSAVKWSGTNSVTKTNISANFYVYDPNNQLFYTSDGTTVSPSPSGSLLVSKQQANIIQSGQAFFIQNAASGSPSITFTEASKTSATTAVASTVFGEDATAKQQLNLNIYRTVGNVFADGVVALFGKDYSANVSMDEDAAKFANFNENFSLRRNDQSLSIEKRPSILGNDTLYFNLSNFGKRDYTFTIDGSNFTNTTATLEDKYTSTKTPIDVTGNTTYQFTVNGDAASSSNDRFIITFGSTASIATTVDATTNGNLFVKMSPNPVTNQLQVNFKTEKVEQATINIVNSLGQVVKTVNAGKTDNGNISIPVSSLATGIYMVQLLSGDKQISVQKIVKE